MTEYWEVRGDEALRGGSWTGNKHNELGFSPPSSFQVLHDHYWVREAEVRGSIDLGVGDSVCGVASHPLTWLGHVPYPSPWLWSSTNTTDEK